MTVELIFSDNVKETTEIATPLPPVIKWLRRDLSTIDRERPVYRQI